MRYLLFILLSFQLLVAQEKEVLTVKSDWEFERINFYFENDVFSSTDNGYTDGGRLAFLMHRPDAQNEWLRIPFIDSAYRAHFISFSLTQQMFTPDDLTQAGLIENDRPYAGWLYFELGLHQSSATDLDSLTLQLGVVGPVSGMEQLQRLVHENIDVPVAQGWDNQLNNEIGIQLNYQHKWRYATKPLWGIDSSFIPYVGGELGNIAIKANAGALLRVGWHVPEDFGSNSIDEGGENGIPIRTKCLCPASIPFSFTLNLAGGGTYVARDIFLDGNTFSESHSVDKKPLKGYGSFGFSARYKNYSMDYIKTYHTKQFENNKPIHSIGSVVFSYLFSS